MSTLPVLVTRRWRSKSFGWQNSASAWVPILLFEITLHWGCGMQSHKGSDTSLVRSRGSACGVRSVCFLSGRKCVGRGTECHWWDLLPTSQRNPRPGPQQCSCPSFPALEMESVWQSILNAKEIFLPGDSALGNDVFFYALGLINKKGSSYLAILILFSVRFQSGLLGTESVRKGLWIRLLSTHR